MFKHSYHHYFTAYALEFPFCLFVECLHCFHCHNVSEGIDCNVVAECNVGEVNVTIHHNNILLDKSLAIFFQSKFFS